MPPNVRRRPSRRCRTSSLPGNRKILLTHQRLPGRVKGRAAFFPPLKGTCERSRIHQRRSRRGAQRQMKFPRLQTDVIKRNPLCARNHPPLRRPPKNAPGLHKCQAPIRLFNCKRTFTTNPQFPRNRSRETAAESEQRRCLPVRRASGRRCVRISEKSNIFYVAFFFCVTRTGCKNAGSRVNFHGNETPWHWLARILSLFLFIEPDRVFFSGRHATAEWKIATHRHWTEKKAD